ncbi:hypothetical protein VNI00_017418 [Paramarasmius palmivorus]|uniref:Uncharacterized protein n=1 Tax=Paramarasmius palmivorus TaxID=297713 RepID=A0AAW0B5E4_9AGAR
MENYDEQNARKALELWIKERSEAEHAKANVSKLLEDSSSMQTMECGIPCAWRLVTPTSEPEEIVFKMQGIIICSELPPFNKHIGRKTNASVLRQGVTLTGLGLPEFDSAVSGIKIGDLMLKRNVPLQGLETLSCFGEFCGVPSVSISNRYFTSRRLAKGEKPVEIGSEIDPAQILRRSSSEFVHIRENVVGYERAQGIDKKELKFQPVSPAIFRVGDIVEVQFTLMTIRPARSLYKTVPVLRTITLLDDYFSKQVDVKAICDASSHRKPSTFAVKRRAGNWDETEETTAKQLRRMEISDGRH